MLDIEFDITFYNYLRNRLIDDASFDFYYKAKGNGIVTLLDHQQVCIYGNEVLIDGDRFYRYDNFIYKTDLGSDITESYCLYFHIDKEILINYLNTIC